MPDDRPAPEKHLFCPSCGTEAATGASFCGDCGHSLEKTFSSTSPVAITGGSGSALVTDRKEPEHQNVEPHPGQGQYHMGRNGTVWFEDRNGTWAFFKEGRWKRSTGPPSLKVLTGESSSDFSSFKNTRLEIDTAAEELALGHSSCPNGHPVEPQWNFCPTCTVPLTNLPSTQEDILANLRGYNKHVNVKCLHCGYSGLMGVIRTQRPWFAHPLLLFAFILTGVGILFVILIVLGGIAGTVYEVQCPSCKRQLIYPAGAKLRGRSG